MQALIVVIYETLCSIAVICPLSHDVRLAPIPLSASNSRSIAVKSAIAVEAYSHQIGGTLVRLDHSGELDEICSLQGC